jgi:hypothetical protein
MDMSLKGVMLAPELPEYLAWIMTLAKVPIFLNAKFSKTTIANDILDTAAVHCTFVFKSIVCLMIESNPSSEHGQHFDEARQRIA